ncbi:MAG: hypothetical protein AAF208_12590 [Cyanobacteria bacterium P01_A01_bin.45]
MSNIFLQVLKQVLQFACLMGIGIAYIQPTTPAVQLRDGKVYFVQPPRLFL